MPQRPWAARTSHLRSRLAHVGVVLLLGSATACAHSTTSRATPATPESVRARELVNGFVIGWRSAFRAAANHGSPLYFRALAAPSMESERWSPGGTPYEGLVSLRLACFDGRDFLEGGWFNEHFPFAARERMYSQRVTRRSAVGYCPDWAGSSLPRFATVVQAHEVLFPPLLRDSVNRSRRALLDSLLSLHERSPVDSVVTGQIVRFALDAGDLPLAGRSADACKASSYYCLRLRAMVQLARQDSVGADTLFEAAWNDAAESGLCDITSLRSLLGPLPLDVPARPSCISATHERATFWWLSNPLWRLSYNVRRVEHEKRQMEISLRQQLHADELLDFSRANEASAIELVNRYGWPDRLLVADSSFERNTRGVTSSHADLPRRPHGASEYSRARSTSIPSSGVFNDPIAADPVEWLRSRPDRGDPFREPWPHEHAWFGRFLAPIEEWQVARMMRGRQLLLVVATPVPIDATQPRSVDTLSAVLSWGSGPARTTLIATGRASAGVMRFVGEAPNEAGVLSAEVFGVSSRDALTAWRLRVGADTLPLTRTSALVGARVSDIVLLDPKADFAAATPSFAQVEGAMLASSMLGPGLTNVGLYWEVYGIPADSRVVTFTLTVRSSRRGALQMLTGLVSRRSEGADDVSTTWERTLAATGLQPEAGELPVGEFLRIGGLVTGRYTVSVRASWGETAGQSASSPTRELSVP